jgi:hypothetical protein
MINIYCLLAIYCLEINHFRIDLLTAFSLKGSSCLRGHTVLLHKQMLITKHHWPPNEWRRKCGVRGNISLCIAQRKSHHGIILCSGSAQTTFWVHEWTDGMYAFFFSKVAWTSVLEIEITNFFSSLTGIINKWNWMGMWLLGMMGNLETQRIYFSFTPAPFCPLGTWIKSC